MAAGARSRAALAIAASLALVALTVGAKPTPQQLGPQSCDSLPPVVWSETAGQVTLENGFVSLVFDKVTGTLSSLAGCLDGSGNYGPSVVSPIVSGTGSLTVEVQTILPNISSTAGALRINPLVVQQTVQTATYRAFKVEGIQDDAVNPIVNCTFSFGLAQGSRQVEFNVSTVVLRPLYITTLRLGMYFIPRSSYMWFNDGVMQSMNEVAPYWVTVSPYNRYYSLDDESGCVDIRFNGALPPVSAIVNGLWDERHSGLHHLYVGKPPMGMWIDGYEGTATTNVRAGFTASSSVLLAPGPYSFPLSDVPTCGRGLPWDDVRALMTGVFSSTVGALVSHEFAPEGRISPCIGTPERCYVGGYNFFDPDTFLSVSAMSYIGDPYLFTEARKLIEANAKFLCNTTSHVCVQGQMPHHYIDPDICPNPGTNGCTCMNATRSVSTAANYFPICPPSHPFECPSLDCVTYRAISGATQTGPNMFWSLTVLQHAAMSGDYDWLKGMMPTLRTAVAFLTNMFDPAYNLLNVPGPLWIDTFHRVNLTTDSNAAMVLLSRRMAEAERLFSHTSGGDFFDALADNIINGMNTWLWDKASDDHYVSYAVPQISPIHPLHVVDFVDYDSNLLAITAGVPSLNQSVAILRRIDRGPCTHARATWVSEIFYNSSSCNANNTGDSAVAMGRIGWADAVSRRQVGSAAAADVFTQLIQQPLLNDMYANTWLPERYTCSGQPTHNPYYIEYPEVITMITAQVKFGLDITLGKVSINPLVATNFSWVQGPVDIDYSSTAFAITVPGTGTKLYEVFRLTPGAYAVFNGTATVSLTVPASGMLNFSGLSGPTARVTGKLLQ